MQPSPILLISLLIFSPSPVLAQTEEFSFDADEFAPKMFEFSGYIEGEPEYARANQDGALYQLQFFDRDPQKNLERFTGTLELEGHVRKGIVGLHFQTHSELVRDYLGDDDDHSLYQGYLSLQPDPGLAVDIGKKAVRWGKGYAWNPVAFVERAKDAGDPDLSREGYWIAAFDWIRRFDGSLQTVALTPLILPVRNDVNQDFGEPGHNNLAAKLYLLYRDIDFDFMFLSNGSRSARVGMDFSKNLAPNFEIHGELAYFNDAVHLTLTDECKRGEPRVEDEISYLIGTRYRTSNDITLIWEYYFNGLGNDRKEQEQFYRCVHQAWESGDQDLIDRLPVGKDLDKGPFSRPNPMRQYMNFRVWWDEPRNLLYLTPGVQVLYNLEDQSFSVSPDISYTGYENLELRLRGTVPVGDSLTEWGEKPNKYKIELRARYYF
jgi:hypothetical protein